MEGSGSEPPYQKKVADLDPGGITAYGSGSQCGTFVTCEGDAGGT
jgi:hypothetical protein